MTDFNEFYSYLRLGLSHILEIKGIDHILFILTLCVGYPISETKKLVILITAFTLGHSITLALAAFKVIVPNTYLIEILIPLTIIVSSVLNLSNRNNQKIDIHRLKYLLALIFGLVHGMGFSNFFNFILGESANIVLPLLSFNIGIEIGQFMIIGLFYLLYALSTTLYSVSLRKYAIGISSLSIIASVYLIIARL